MMTSADFLTHSSSGLNALFGSGGYKIGNSKFCLKNIGANGTDKKKLSTDS